MVTYIYIIFTLQYAAADDDPLPAIEDLQISGDPYPGREILACGISVNGTTSCNFEVLVLGTCFLRHILIYF